MSASIGPDAFSKYAPRWVREGTEKPRDIISSSPDPQLATAQDEPPPWRSPGPFDDLEVEQTLDPPDLVDTTVFESDYVHLEPAKGPFKTAGEISFAVIAMVTLALVLDDTLTNLGTASAEYREYTTATTAPDNAAAVETTATTLPVTNVGYVVSSSSSPAPLQTQLQQQLDPQPVEQRQAQPVPTTTTAPDDASVVVTAVTAPPMTNTEYVVTSSSSSAPPQVQPAPQLDPQPVEQRQQVQPVPVQRVSKRVLDPEEINQLIKRGEAFLAQGDVATARLFLLRGAEAHDARATLLLGTTYDPDVLGRMGAVGIRPDPEKAHLWYAQAAEFGSHEASRRLAALAQPTR
jgi:hypothetical protein